MLATCGVIYFQGRSAVAAINLAADAVTKATEEPGMQNVERAVDGEVTHRRRRAHGESITDWIDGFIDAVGGTPDHEDCWKSGEAEYTVRTWCRPNETAPNCETRHDEAVALLKETFPDEGECDE